MPTLTVDGKAYEVPSGKRLVLALTDECGIDQLHACGGQARCTTCRVQFESGEPEKATEAEKSVLELRGLAATPGLRLSCQMCCDADMSVTAISRLAG
ncbi:MAG TPA: 2Fe-2S iron-sulfur cluster-binding protein, partial [Tepidisphaeraceae bacterium]|nr:2Fe-2S iron-sulfur cluster-binding protein [Tepidisphaeraceae bacterium]